MKCKFLSVAVLLLLTIMVFAGALSTVATVEEDPAVPVPTENITESIPGEGETETETESESETESGSETETGSDVSDPTDSTAPSETTDLTDPSESTAPISRPTEFDESQPEDQTYSPYDATESPYQAPSYNAGEENWGHIDYKEIGLENKEAQAGKIDFSGVQGDTSSEDKRSYLLTNIAVVLLILAIIGITVFVLTFVFEANRKKTQTATATKKQVKVEAKKRSANHYRDGF